MPSVRDLRGCNWCLECAGGSAKRIFKQLGRRLAPGQAQKRSRGLQAFAWQLGSTTTIQLTWHTEVTYNAVYAWLTAADLGDGWALDVERVAGNGESAHPQIALAADNGESAHPPGGLVAQHPPVPPALTLPHRPLSATASCQLPPGIAVETSPSWLAFKMLCQMLPGFKSTFEQDYVCAKGKEACLGAGTYGTVCFGRRTSDEQVVAVKTLKARDEWAALGEVAILEGLRGHPNIVALLDVAATEKSIHMILEHADCDWNIRLKKVGCTHEERQGAMRDMLAGLMYIHGRDVIHSDLKPANLLVKTLAAGGLRTQLADFGCARVTRPGFFDPLPLQDVMQTGVQQGTLWYRSPEQLLGESMYDSGVDMWATGCVLAELAQLDPIFPASSQVGMLFKIFWQLGIPSGGTAETFRKLPLWDSKKYGNFPHRPWSDTLSAALGPSGVDLLGSLLVLAPADRQPANICLSHLFLIPGASPEANRCEPSQPRGPNLTDTNKMQLLCAANGSAEHCGGRGPFAVVFQDMSGDVLAWLRGDEVFRGGFAQKQPIFGQVGAWLPKRVEPTPDPGLAGAPRHITCVAPGDQVQGVSQCYCKVLPGVPRARSSMRLVGIAVARWPPPSMRWTPGRCCLCGLCPSGRPLCR